MKHISSSRHAFTLVELLVVIAIIGILAGMGFAGFHGAMDKARRIVAKNDAVQIASAVLLFETEYGKLPPGGSGDNSTPGDVDDDLMRVLTADEGTGEGESVYNRRKIVFLENIGPAGSNKSGTNETGAFVDPWGNPYQIVMDVEFDNEITVPSAKSGETIKLRKRVGVWAQTNEESRIIITSWD